MERNRHRETVLPLSDQEWQVIRLIRELGYGQLMITVRDGKPCRVERPARASSQDEKELQGNK